MARPKSTENKDVKVKFSSNVAILKDQLEEANEMYKGDDSILSIELLTRPLYISANRTIMFTSHTKQLMTLTNPEFPRVFTGYENMTGNQSTGIQRAKRRWTVIGKSYKFEEGNHLYTLFVKDEESGYYDVIQKKIVEDLVEKFGFKYNNSNLDEYNVGDVIEKGEVLFKSTSYDEDNNYRFGLNATFAYTADVRTTEDAIKVSESFAKKMKCVEVETIKVSINDNDVLLNLYGDENNYKCFPDIGETIKNKVICATRRINNDQIFFDFKESNLRKINFGEDTLCVENGLNGKIIDIKVYSNKTPEELENNLYHKQILDYYNNELRYYKEVVENTKDVIKLNKPHSRNFNYMYKKCSDILDDKIKWCEQHGKKPFSNIILEFTVEREVELKDGSKITGLIGNKGVVSTIVPDDEMPILENGKIIDVQMNILGIIGRLNSWQLFEQSITFVLNRTIDRCRQLENNDQRFALIYEIISQFNTNQANEMLEVYKRYNDSEKEEFMQDVYKRGLYLHIPPFWHNENLIDVLTRVYDKYGEWLTPYQVFQKINGRYRPIMNKMFVGEMYMIRLKQTAAKGFSARSVGGVSLIGTPVKDAQAKENKILYSKTPCRFMGFDELLNLLIGMNPIDIAKMTLSYRGSIEGMRSLAVDLLKNGMPEELRGDEEVINRNVEVLDSYMKTMGYVLEPSQEVQELVFENIDDDEIKVWDFDNQKVECTTSEYIEMCVEKELNEFINDDIFIGTREEWEEIKEYRRGEILDKWRNNVLKLK